MITVTDEIGCRTGESFEVTVNSVNDPPAFDPMGDLTINEDAPVQTVNLTGISSGAPNEVQTLTVTAVSGNPVLIPNPVATYTSSNSTAGGKPEWRSIKSTIISGVRFPIPIALE